MAAPPRYLVDTNILVRLAKRDDPQHGLVRRALDRVVADGNDICCVAQNLIEFWNVCTRPSDRNGWGLSILETRHHLDQVERTMTLLPDSDDIYPAWRDLVALHQVRGAQVHDARLVAAMQVHGVTQILTLNVADFQRYTAIESVHPGDVGR